ncbi:sugar transferase [Mucilaginibacter xinganensis]|uniref:Polysaccharide biosynthesis polyprenyl glycosylphosphotransferase n=1 Tax=Mucilaginibacter xinganensis TaxID=1234841 RepID=A0A223NY09_9SPHI|nr:sugar transferase [Mucilaginibacter xinganensis]ASU34745.1 polysaccharide biosynthesis polyprenyl glycosylphosphotransferase [Mucilaginibacter xinganensis]
MMLKRAFDICLSLTGIIVLSPLFILTGLFIMIDSNGPVLYIQQRVGRNCIDFGLLKFRTMYVHADRLGCLTIGSHDPRITRIGLWLRKFKVDELPQLFNVLAGHMSFVGPRPEVRKYVDLYTPYQLKVLSIKPGLTDWASIQYFDENDLLAGSDDPEKFYINKIIPSKITYNLKYIDHHNLWVDLKIIAGTLKKIFHT